MTARAERTEHAEFASRLRRQVLQPDQATPVDVRREVFDGATTSQELNELASTIRTNANTVTDGQIAALVASTGSERAAFEIIMTAAIGAGLQRWDAALAAIEGAPDATP